MRYIIVIILAICLTGCSITYRLERKQSRAVAAYAPSKLVTAQKQNETKTNIETKRDSSTPLFVATTTDENGEKIMCLDIGEVVVVSSSRTLPERRGKVMIDFVVTLPKELQGSCQSVSVTPWLHKFDREVPLQELSVRGGMFSRVQDRNYWQFNQFVKIFRPDAQTAQRAYEKFIKHPYPEGVRLDSVVEARGNISYFYTQEVSTQGEGKKMFLTLKGEVIALDGSRYQLPPSDTLQYNISSMLTFVDTTTRYVTKIVEKYAVVNDRNYLSFKVNDTQINDTLCDNQGQLAKIEELMDRLINQDTFIIDSIILTASASPEGSFERNNLLAGERAMSLKKRLVEKFGIANDTLITVRRIAEDWTELARLIGNDSSMLNKDGILEIIRTVNDPDKREAKLRDSYPKEYKHIRGQLYPLLRSVNFKYDLRRVGMVKDTIHTTEPDTIYARGVKLLEERRYAEALRILSEYNDQNSAVALMSLGYDNEAFATLSGLPETAITNYLSAIVCARLGRIDQGRELFVRACKLNETFEYRGKLDPEISKLL